jgi:hypothetical protein
MADLLMAAAARGVLLAIVPGDGRPQRAIVSMVAALSAKEFIQVVFP